MIWKFSFEFHWLIKGILMLPDPSPFYVPPPPFILLQPCLFSSCDGESYSSLHHAIPWKTCLCSFHMETNRYTSAKIFFRGHFPSHYPVGQKLQSPWDPYFSGSFIYVFIQQIFTECLLHTRHYSRHRGNNSEQNRQREALLSRSCITYSLESSGPFILDQLDRVRPCQPFPFLSSPVSQFVSSPSSNLLTLQHRFPEPRELLSYPIPALQQFSHSHTGVCLCWSSHRE